MTRFRVPGLLLIVVLTLTACPQRTAVWVKEGSTLDNLVFQFGTRRGVPGGAQIGVVRVYRCNGSATGPGAMWVVGPVGGTANVLELAYGEPPPDFSADQGPVDLQPGCYRIDVSGTGKAEFIIDTNGEVSERLRGS